MEILSSGLGYVLSALLWGALTVSVILHIGRRSRAFLYIALYALACLLLESTVRAMARPSAILNPIDWQRCGRPWRRRKYPSMWGPLARPER